MVPPGSPPLVAESGGSPRSQEYATLGPKFYMFSALSPRICFCFVNPYFLSGIAAFCEILLLAMSKYVLEPPGIFFEKMHAALDSQVAFFTNCCPQRET